MAGAGWLPHSGWFGGWLGGWDFETSLVMGPEAIETNTISHRTVTTI